MTLPRLAAENHTCAGCQLDYAALTVAEASKLIANELAANVTGFREEVGRVSPVEWLRVATRRPDETRTARWMGRQAVHEGVHHVRDSAAGGRANP